MLKQLFSRFFAKISISFAALVISIAYVLIIGASPSYAAVQGVSAMGEKIPQGTSPIYWQCFKITQTVQVTGTNTWAVHGTITYDCNPQRQGGGLTITTTINCPVPSVGSRTSTTYSSFGQKPYTQGYIGSYLQNFTGYCEACTNHIPVDFPFFTVDVQTSAESAYSNVGINGVAIGESGIGHIGLTNSPAYVTPC